MTGQTEPTTADTTTTDTTSKGDIEELIAETLDIPIEEVSDSLSLHDLPEWSSLDHITLMLALEEHLDRPIDGPLTAELTSVQAIKRWASNDSTADHIDLAIVPAAATEPGPVIHRGLDGVHLDTSTITGIDGAKGRLVVRGYPIEELAEHATFGEVCHLVLFGSRPRDEEVATLTGRLIEPPPLPAEVVDLIERMTDRHPMVVLRTSLSLLGETDPGARETSGPATIDRGIDLIAWTLQILSHHHHASHGAGNHNDDPTPAHPADSTSDRWPIAANFLQVCFGRPPAPVEAEALDLLWRLQADHGSNASTFAARVTAAAGTDLAAALVSGLSTFAGALHGGAVQGVMDGIREIGQPERAQSWVTERRTRRQPIMGYGHRVYRVADPRGRPLRAMTKRLATHRGDQLAMEVTEAVERAMAPYERAGLGVNVDTYAAILCHLLGFPDIYGTAIYAAARSVGWVAHAAEQVDRNVLIRPRLEYVGPEARSWEPSPPARDRVDLVVAR